VHEVDRLLVAAEGGDVVVSEAFAADPGASGWIEREAPGRQVVVLGGLVGQRLTFT
jgi:hypothetical protein